MSAVGVDVQLTLHPVHVPQNWQSNFTSHVICGGTLTNCVDKHMMLSLHT